MQTANGAVNIIGEAKVATDSIIERVGSGLLTNPLRIKLWDVRDRSVESRIEPLQFVLTNPRVFKPGRVKVSTTSEN